MKKILVLLALTSLTGCGFKIVDTGERGVETQFGKVIGDALPEGMQFYNPFTSDVTTLSIKTITSNDKTIGYTKDVQQATIEFSVNYNLNSDSVTTVYRTVGRDWQAKLVTQAVPAIIKNVIGKWEAVELVSNRQKATSEIEQTLITELAKNGVTITRFEITNITYVAEFEKAVESKVVAIQRAAEAENKTKQIEEEAKQKVISAKAEAESMRIRSDALSQNKSLVDYEAVQKWDGKLPQYVMGNSMPFVNLKKD